MSSPHALTKQELPHFETVDLSNFKEVDMLYNVSRLEGRPARGLDFIRNDGQQRVYVVRGSHLGAEALIRRSIGTRALPKTLENLEDFSVYELTLGAVMLSKTLAQTPPIYSPEYMARLKSRGQELVDKLHQLDRNAFGISLEEIAVFHNGGFNISRRPDDTYMVVIPPVVPSNGGRR